jgi:hypothetical protein
VSFHALLAGNDRTVVSATPPFECSEIDLRQVRHADCWAQQWEFPCECGEAGCRERVFLTLDEYIELNERGGVVLADGHSRSQIEHERARTMLNVAREV